MRLRVRVMRVLAEATGDGGKEVTGAVGFASGNPGIAGSVDAATGRAIGPPLGSFKKMFTPRFSGSGSLTSRRRLSWRRYSTASLMVVCRNSMLGMMIEFSLRWMATVPWSSRTVPGDAALGIFVEA